MTSTYRIALYARSLFVGRARVLAASLMIFCAAHLSVPLYGQSLWGANPTWLPPGTNFGIGIPAPLWNLHVSSTGAITYSVTENTSASGRSIFGVFSNQNGSYGGLDARAHGPNFSDSLFGVPMANNVAIVGTPMPGSSHLMAIGNYANGPMIFGTNNIERARIDASGNVAIGTTTTGQCGTATQTCRLTVNGAIGAKEIVVVASMFADYVFKPDYRLKPLTEVAAYIKENHHLPEIPSETEVKEQGVSLGEMQVKLLAKVEELTLHAIRADDRNNRLEQQNQELRDRIARLEARAQSATKQ